MHNMVWFFDESAFHIYHWPQKIAKTFCKAFYVHYQNMYCIDYVGLDTCSQLFWGFGNLFWSMSQCSIQSILIWSIHHENNNWPNFFSRSCLLPIRSIMLSVKVDQKPFSKSEIWSIWVLRKILPNIYVYLKFCLEILTTVW